MLASGSDAFFWGSTLGALALLVAYLLVVVSAAGGAPAPLGGSAMAAVHSGACGPGDRLHAAGVNVYPPQPGAYRAIPWLVLAWCCVPVIATLLHPRPLQTW